MLKPLSHFFEGVAKLHRLCDVLQNVADLYVKAKTQEPTHIAMARTNNVQLAMDHMQPAISDVDGYISAIGFAPPAPGYHSETSADNGQVETDYLSGWFIGNTSLIGLLDDLNSSSWLDPSYMPNQ